MFVTVSGLTAPLTHKPPVFLVVLGFPAVISLGVEIHGSLPSVTGFMLGVPLHLTMISQ